jgi:Ca2+-transporting ATPase
LHIAFLELVVDPACSLVFEGEPAEADVMQRPPRDANAPLFSGRAMLLALVQGIGVWLVVLAGYAWAVEQWPEPYARAFAFSSLVAGNLGLILSNRSRSCSLWASLRTPNRSLWLVVGLAMALLLLTLYLPALTGLFLFAPLGLAQLLAALALGLLSVVWFEAVKYVHRQREAARRL